MNEYIFAQGFNCAVLLLTSLFACWQYHRRISKPIQIKEFQYRIFALRDRAIRLVADGTVSEESPEWQKLYRHLNGAAHSATVGRMTNGLRFILKLLSSGPPTMSDRKAFSELPAPIKRLLMDYVHTVLAICWQGSWCLRFAVWSATRFAIAKRMLDRFKPNEASCYRQWVASERAMAHAA